MNDLMELTAIFPELLLCVALLGLVLLASLRGQCGVMTAEVLGIFALAAAGVLLWLQPQDTVIVLNDLFISDRFSQYVKALVLIGTAVALLLSYRYVVCLHIDRPEFPVLLLFAALGMMIIASANDLITLYVGLELQSLSLYILAAFRRDDLRSSEAGLKYFVLGALSSGVLLYGISLVYGYAGTTNFTSLSSVLPSATMQDLPILFGVVFILAALAFKVAAVPFHMWAPDVYEGAPTPVTAFFAAVPKVAAFALIMRLCYEPFAGILASIQPILWCMAAGSMLLGALGAMAQTNIKRMMAYSSIGHAGVMLAGLATGTAEGLQASLVYLAIYFLLSLGTFAVILCLRRDGVMLEKLSDMKGLARTRPVLGLATVIFMFSLAGVPPLAGFFGKFAVFMALLQADLIWLAVIGVISSAVAAYYYLRIIKLVYFDAPEGGHDAVDDPGLRIALTVTAAYMVMFCFVPQTLLSDAFMAAQSLLGG